MLSLPWHIRNIWEVISNYTIDNDCSWSIPSVQQYFLSKPQQRKNMSKEEKQERNIIFGVYIFIYFSTIYLFLLPISNKHSRLAPLTRCCFCYEKLLQDSWDWILFSSHAQIWPHIGSLWRWWVVCGQTPIQRLLWARGDSCQY